MKKEIGVIGSICAAVLILYGCEKNGGSRVPAASETAAAASESASSPFVAVTTPSTPPPPRHNYAMVDSGSYGYEPALSEEDVRNGTATKPLIMMRYVGNKNGTFVIIILGQDANNSSITTRVSCEAPCEFAKSELMSGDAILKTETLRVTPDSIFGAMLTDAISGQLVPYGRNETSRSILSSPAPAATTSTTAANFASSDTPAALPQQSQGADASLQQTSFDCSKAKSIPEYLICHDPDLAAADRDLAVVYRQAKDAVVDKAAFTERTRKQWNFREKNCRDKECLLSWYGYQKRVLTKIAQTGDVSVQDQ